MIRITSSQLIEIPKEKFKGKIICFPTDTVYGIGAMFEDELAKSRIYDLKMRASNKPLANLASNIEQITPYIETNEMIDKLMDGYWPGALTIIFKKRDTVSDVLTNGLATIAFRIPNAKVALQIINHLGIMATTSINLSGEAPLNSEEEIEKHFGDRIDYFITDKQDFSKAASTIVDVSQQDIKIVRVGDINLKLNV